MLAVLSIGQRPQPRVFICASFDMVGVCRRGLNAGLAGGDLGHPPAQTNLTRPGPMTDRLEVDSTTAITNHVQPAFRRPLTL